MFLTALKNINVEIELEGYEPICFKVGMLILTTWLWNLILVRGLDLDWSHKGDTSTHRYLEKWNSRSAYGKWNNRSACKRRKGKGATPNTSVLQKSNLSSVTKRKPSPTARLEDTTQTRKHSICCHDTNRPPSFSSEQAIADWIAISKGLA